MQQLDEVLNFCFNINFIKMAEIFQISNSFIRIKYQNMSYITKNLCRTFEPNS